MKAAVLYPPQEFRVTELAPPGLPENGALVSVTGCGICGSDLDKLLNRHMPEGTVLGHEVTGRIRELSDGAAAAHPELQVGQRVSVAHHVPCQTCYYCRHDAPSMCPHFKQTNIFPGGFSEIIAVSAAHLAHTVFPLPDTLSDIAGSCIEPLGCCLRAIDRIPSAETPHVLLIGLGFIGLMTGQALGLKGYHTYGIDLKAERVAMAQEHQWVHNATHEEARLLETIMAATDGRGVDTVFLSVVTPATLDLATRAVRDGGTLMLFTSYGPGTPVLNQNTLYFRELTVMTSYSPSLKSLQEARDMIFSGQIQVEPLITHRFSLAELNQGMQAYRSENALKVFIEL